MRTTFSRLVPVLVFATACATTAAPVPLEETGAEGHRQEADRERQIARTLEREAAHRPWEVDPSYSPDRDRAMGYQPANDRMDEAERRRAHAAAHAAAASRLERFEAEACAGVDPLERAACPLLGPVSSIRDIRGGVRIELTADTPVAALAASMRCHHAFARARGFTPEAASCPLYMSGIQIRRSADGAALEILGSTTAMVAEVRRRSRQEAVRVPADTARDH
jgi:hypothetical protein